jgi:hypothetical protein
MRHFTFPIVLLSLAIFGCSSDLSKSAAASAISDQMKKDPTELMVGFIKRQRIQQCVAALKQANASEKLIQNVGILGFNGYVLYAPVKLEFIEVEGVEHKSDVERVAQFTYRIVLNERPTTKDVKPITADQVPDNHACLAESPAFQIIAGAMKKNQPGNGTLSAKATFKKFSDGWRLDNFATALTGPLEMRPPFMLVPEDQQ